MPISTRRCLAQVHVRSVGRRLTSFTSFTIRSSYTLSPRLQRALL